MDSDVVVSSVVIALNVSGFVGELLVVVKHEKRVFLHQLQFNAIGVYSVSEQSVNLQISRVFEIEK